MSERRQPFSSAVSAIVAVAGGVFAVGAAIGALAIGALAVGAVSVGAIVVGKLAMRRAAIEQTRLGTLEIDELVVRRLRVAELSVTDDLQLPELSPSADAVKVLPKTPAKQLARRARPKRKK